MNVDFSYWKNIRNGRLDTKDLMTLPLTHNIEFCGMQNIIAKNKLELPEENAPVFKEPTLFFYYGVPAYYKKKMSSPSIILFEADEYFFNELNWSPFDSGAVEKGLIEEITLKNFKRDFILHAKKKSDEDCINFLKKHIKLFFEDNESYIKGDFNKNRIKGKQWNDNLIRTYKVYNSKGRESEINDVYAKTLSDRRIKLIEGHINEEVLLKRLKPIFCYIPETGKEFVKEAFDISDEFIIDYDPFLTSSSSEIIHEGMFKALDFIKNKLKKHKELD